MLRAAAPVEVGRRGRGREALHARPDRHRDHVLLQPLVVADAGVAAGGQHVDEAVLRDDLQPDVGIGGEEGRHDRGQHQPRRADRHVEPQRARRPVAEAVDHVERRLHLAQRRAEPVEQARAGLGRRHAARGAVEQPHAEPRLQPAHRLAERRGAAAAGARASRKPPARATATKAVRSPRSALIVRLSARPVRIMPDYRAARAATQAQRKGDSHDRPSTRPAPSRSATAP